MAETIVTTRSTVTTRAKKENAGSKSWYRGASPKLQEWIWHRGVNSADEVVVHSPDQNALHKEVLRKNIDGYAVVSDTKIRYSCTLTPSELAGEYISEVGLYDAQGDFVALKAIYEKR